jgi:two-component system response regulator DegU
MRKILLVEDHSSFRQALKNIIQLGNPSMVNEEAADGKEALQKVDALHPDLIFMDIGLPGESGLQITRKIRKNYPDIIIAVLTSYDEESDREAAFECGVNYFIYQFVEELLSYLGVFFSPKFSFRFGLTFKGLDVMKI